VWQRRSSASRVPFDEVTRHVGERVCARLRVGGTGSGQFTIPQLAPGECWIDIPETTVTRPSPGEVSGQHSPSVPTTYGLLKIPIR